MSISKYSSRTPRLGRPPVKFRDNIIELLSNIESFGIDIDEVESMVPRKSIGEFSKIDKQTVEL